MHLTQDQFQWIGIAVALGGIFVPLIWAEVKAILVSRSALADRFQVRAKTPPEGATTRVFVRLLEADRYRVWDMRCKIQGGGARIFQGLDISKIKLGPGEDWPELPDLRVRTVRLVTSHAGVHNEITLRWPDGKKRGARIAVSLLRDGRRVMTKRLSVTPPNIV